MSIYTITADDVIRSKMDSKGRVTVPKDVREQWRAEGGDHVEFAVVDVEGRGYECDECSGRFDLPEVFYDEESGRVVCGECAGVKDRITQ